MGNVPGLLVEDEGDVLHLRVPAELADDLIAAGHARVSRKPRGSFLEWMVSGANGAAVWIAILHTPATIQ